MSFSIEQLLTAVAQVQANAPAAPAPPQPAFGGSHAILQQLLAEAARPKPQPGAQAVLPENFAQMIAEQVKKEMESGQGVQQPEPQKQEAPPPAPHAEPSKGPASSRAPPARPAAGTVKGGPPAGGVVRESDIKDMTDGKPWTKPAGKTAPEDRRKPPSPSDRSVLTLCKIMTFEYVDNQMIELYARVVNKPGFKRKAPAPTAPAKPADDDDKEPPFEEESADEDNDKEKPQSSSTKPREPDGFLASIIKTSEVCILSLPSFGACLAVIEFCFDSRPPPKDDRSNRQKEADANGGVKRARGGQKHKNH